MTKFAEQKALRRTHAHAASRVGILDAARRVAIHGEGRKLSLRNVAAEAGFAPAALYGYFANKDELLLALAADDLATLARAMRDAAAHPSEQGRLGAAVSAALALLKQSECLAAASGALSINPGPGHPERLTDCERLFNGRLIAVLKILSDAAGNRVDNRDGQCDAVLVAATVAGLALMVRTGRLEALGFLPDEILKRLNQRFGA